MITNWIENRRNRGVQGSISRYSLLERTVLPRLRERKLKGHTGCVNTCRWNETGTTIASGSDDTRILIYKRKSKDHEFECVRRIETDHSANIFSVDYLSNDDELISGAMDGRVLKHSHGRRSQLYQYRGSCFKVERRKDNESVVVSSGFGGVHVHDLRSRCAVSFVTMSGDGEMLWGEPYGMKLNPAMPYLLTVAGGFPFVLTFDLRRPPPSNRMTSLRDAVHSIRLKPRSACTCIDISQVCRCIFLCVCVCNTLFHSFSIAPATHPYFTGWT
jgi:WD40 repeat protein